MSPAKKVSAKKAAATRPPVARMERERREFTALLAENPNYFGTMPAAGIAAKKAMSGNTKYEALSCVAFSPERDVLEATVAVKLPYGYGGDLCAQGSREYVRFYVDYGGGWEDAGAAGVEVHDLPAGSDCTGRPRHPISYVASLAYDPRRRACTTPVLPRVRAILSWQVLPPPGQPDWPPVWGDVHECDVQIRPRPVIIADLLEHLKPQLPKIEIPEIFEEVAEVPIPPPPPPEPLQLAALKEMYAAPARGAAKAKAALQVEPHRFGFADLAAALLAPVPAPELALAKSSEWKAIDLDWAEAVTLLVSTSGDTRYEELECVGLDNNQNALVGTFRVKLPSGYSGSLCSKGSIEYVAFWADWHDTCDWTYLGRVEVGAHDLSPLPDGGLCYSAILPVDLSTVRRSCKEPVIGRVRAVLSWATPPSDTNPDAVPHWGNRIDVHVQVRPGPAFDPANPIARISILGGVETGMIDDVTGLTTPGAVFADNGLHTDWIAPHSRPCPFAGIVTVKGPSFPGYRYRVLVRPLGGGWSPVTTSYRTVNWLGFGTDRYPDPLTGWTDYLNWWDNVSGLLGRWPSSGNDLYEVALEIQGVAGIDVHRAQLDNTLPEPNMVKLDITTGIGNCGKFGIGQPITGTFTARDAYFAQYTLTTSPFNPPPGQLVPSSSTVQTPPGGAGWSLNTTGMQACGYVIVLTVSDLAIVNSAWTGRTTQAVQGFCLE